MTESKPQRWRHLKRGSTYTEIARGELQSTHPLREGVTLVAYRSEHDGRVWFRPQAEFEDGRFERLPDPPNSSPIPPERVPEALRELADLMVPVRKLQERILAAAGPPIFDHPQRLRDRASRLEAELAKGGAR